MLTPSYLGLLKNPGFFHTHELEGTPSSSCSHLCHMGWNTSYHPQEDVVSSTSHLGTQLFLYPHRVVGGSSTHVEYVS